MELTFSEVLRFGYFVGFVVIVCFLIPIFIRVAECIRSLNDLIKKNEDNLTGVMNNVNDITKNVDEVSSYTKDKILNIDTYVKTIKKGISLVKDKKKN
ncbi:DUF948 domain-containing protein [Clostridiaceae bacterium M8S5]|nr:DUF948 domain-containing protein [Clostridiaceae bacterium M8S5]